jgi:hypothetical protein
VIALVVPFIVPPLRAPGRRYIRGKVGPW